VTNLADQLARLLGISAIPPGSWVLIPNQHLLVNGQRWAPSDGSHPAIVIEYRGPHVYVYPRSATIKAGLEHAPHDRDHTLSCQINKKGYIKTRTRIRLESLVLERATFSCYEPEETGVLRGLGIS